MYYTIYKTTNKVNGKYYIGKHQTVLLTDSYMGSGKLLRRAIQKYGSDNFVKEVLHTFDTEEEMNAKEKELVVVSKDTYNICEGGKGGFGYINKTTSVVVKRTNTLKQKNHYSIIAKKQKGIPKTAEHNRKNSESNKGKLGSFIGHKHSEETKEKMRQKAKGRTPWNKGKTWVSVGVWK